MVNLLIPLVSLSFIIGCASVFEVVLPLQYISIAIVIFAGLTAIFLRYRIFVLVCVSLIAFLFGMMRVVYVHQNQFFDWNSLYETDVEVTGAVRENADERNAHSRYIVNVHTITDQTGTVYHPKGGILVYEPYPTACVSGEEVSMKTRLQEPEDFITETNRVFQYGDHLLQENVHAIVFLREGVCSTETEHASLFSALRERFMNVTRAILPLEEGSLLGGLLLGLRGALSDEMLEIFRITGLVHIIVLSGYNITLVAEAVRRLLSRMHYNLSIIFSVAAIVAFVFLAGAQTAAIRAGGMAVVALMARALHREYDGIRILFFVGALMALYNPYQVLFSASFHMSFLATLGLLLYAPIFERWLARVPDRFQIRSIIAATLSTQFFLLPYLAYAIGEVSGVGILANILILPLVPVAMACGAAIIGIALIAPMVAEIAAPAVYLPLAAIIRIADFLAIERAMLLLPEIPGIVMVVIIAVMTCVGISAVDRKDVV